MDYSIVIPVFNREDLTRNCLATLQPTLAGAGNGEVIVVDNGSQPQTAAVLAEFPWLRVVTNLVNLGFAAACNQGARAASGRLVCHLNNDVVAQPGWLERMIRRLDESVGVVGARLFFPDGTIQHAGVALEPSRFGPAGFRPYHLYEHWAPTIPASREPSDFEAVTGACLLTPRELFLELGGFDEAFWNGNEDVDYCLRVRARGLRVVYEPDATLVHFEPHTGIARKRRTSHNLKTLGERWAASVEPDQNRFWPRSDRVRREYFVDTVRDMALRRLPKTTIVVHGDAPVDVAALMASLRDTRIAAESIVWLAAGSAPPGTSSAAGGAAALGTVRELLAVRGDRYVAFINSGTRLEPGWLDQLVNAIEFGSEVAAATVAPEGAGAVEPCAADARCTLLNLRDLPVHVRIGDVATVDGALVDITFAALQLGLGVRAVRGRIAALPPPVDDERFTARHGTPHDLLRRAAIARMEAACADPVPAPTLASIVMLSWNAPEYTRMAVESIRAYTRSPHEIIIIDNGSGAETRAMLAALDGVTVIYNSTNMGFAHGCNQGIAAARGTHVVLLNNDVIVTAGWLDALLAAQRRDPLVGVSAPRSNRIVGHQQIGVSYDSVEGMHAFAAARTGEFGGMHYRTDRAIGFCLCIARHVIDEVGGIDTRYGVGNFEDDDYCIRVRAAGYGIAVCEDAFIHHFGSVSFQANKVDYSAQMQKNWQIFAARWGFPNTYPSGGYDPTVAIGRGFVRLRDYVPLPPLLEPVPAHDSARPQRSYATAFVAVVDSEAAWSRIGPIVTNYVKALAADDSSLFAIGAGGATDAATIGARIARSIDRLELEDDRVADIHVVDIDPADLDGWVAAIPARALLRVLKDERLEQLVFAPDRSPSGLARTVRGDKR